MAVPATRTRADAVRNRARVVAAAAEVFAEKGEDAVVPDIAARAGVGKGTVYRCFPTKEHLIAAVATERARWFEREARAAAADADPWAAFRAFLARVAEAYCRDRGMVFSMSQGLETPGAARGPRRGHGRAARADGPRDRPGRRCAPTPSRRT